MKLNADIPKALLRISLALVFLYFGISQLTNQTYWIGFVPTFLTTILPATKIVFLNGILEVILGTFLLIGLYTRISSLILSLHLAAITLSIGFEPTGIRDFGLTIATLTIFLSNVDQYTLDYKLKKSKLSLSPKSNTPK